MKITAKWGVGLLCAAALVVTPACKRKKQTEEASEAAKQNAVAESIYQDAQFMGDEAARGPESFTTFNANCATVSYDTAGVSVTVTIDYGTTNCLCNDNKYRRGKMIITYNAPNFNAVGNVITWTPENYFVNDNGVAGSRRVEHTSQTEWKINANATITLAENQGSFTWKSDRIRTQVAGENTFMLQDNEYTITGSAEGKTAAGNEYTIDIQKPLEIQLGCRWIKAGTLSINSSNLTEPATIDYGTGSCDNFATLTYKGREKEINL